MLANYNLVGKFVGTAEKFNFSYDFMLERDRHELFERIMGYNAQNAFLVGNRKFVYRIGAKTRQMDAYVGALSQEFANNYMGAETDNWLWSGVGFSAISVKAIASETYDLGG